MIKILIIRLTSLGDIIHTYPMIYDIKNNISNCQIDWLVDKSLANMVQINPLINNVHTIDLRKWTKNKILLIKNIYSWYCKLNTDCYDYIIDSQGLIKSAFLTKLFKGRSFGYDIKSTKEKLATLFYNNKIEVSKNNLAINRNRILAQKIFHYQINLNVINFGLENILVNEPILQKKYVIFFHATSKDSKKYSNVSWQELATFLIKEYDFLIILPFGTDKEKDEALQIKQLTNHDNVIVPEQKTNINYLINLIFYAEFIFGVDTGLVHLANALNKKLIGLYIDTNPQKTGVIETNNAKNIGNIGQKITVKQVINLFDIINRVKL